MKYHFIKKNLKVFHYFTWLFKTKIFKKKAQKNKQNKPQIRKKTALNKGIDETRPRTNKAG